MDGASSVELLLRLGLSLVVVLGLMAGAAALLRRRGTLLGGRRPGAVLEVVARQQLGKTASVAVVRAGGRGLIIGVTEQSVRMLGEADLEELEVRSDGAPGTALPAGVESPQSAWTVLLDRMRERTVRRI